MNIRKLFGSWSSSRSGETPTISHNRRSESQRIKLLKKQYGLEKAMQLAVGGEFKAFGTLQRELLIQFGLRKSDYVIDVGCGSGRLALSLSEYLSGEYLSIDIQAELVDYARSLVNRGDWRFEIAYGLTIPEQDRKADLVCFFSVFTHLLHEESFLYLKEAVRVMKAAGKIIFSFLEFSVPCHWEVFAASIQETKDPRALNVFLSRDAIQA